MRCERCHEREAKIHVTAIIADRTEKHDFCEECGPECSPSGAYHLDQILEAVTMVKAGHFPGHPYLPKAFLFPVEAVDFLRNALEIGLRTKGTQHLSGRELLEYLRLLALERFGANAKSVLNSWGIRRTEDFGELVFALVNARWLAKRDEDSMEDFKNGYDFDEAFPET
jgi:uncharacterized repeat protein (TIGR04138 family)